MAATTDPASQPAPTARTPVEDHPASAGHRSAGPSNSGGTRRHDDAATRPRTDPPAPVRVEDIREVLRDVVDPELGVNVVDLGLVYGIRLDQDGTVVIDLTLTSPACPLSPLMEHQVRAVLAGVTQQVALNWVWTPPWGPQRITDDGREQLRALGFNV